ncbi:MAG TPA: ABC transporter ATP-binding protein [Candidatus Bathyarchaeia archaeon]|nr:ABC transporter ATP-binding protein [Candidatus Bathyarchaeia archaeon]
MSSPSIEAVNLTKSYGSFTALSNLSLKIEGSKCVGFLGPNGAGKTTTLKIFTDMIRASQGKALINGIDVHTNKKKALASCGALIESPEIYPSLTPREALSMVSDLRGLPKHERASRIKEVVAEVKMDEWLDKKVGKFSKGMKQRINVAAALLSDPQIVMLDEPTTGLDPRGQSEVRDIVKSLKLKNRLVFMSSHLLNEVSEICDEVAIIDHGKLVVYDTLANVTRRFSGDGSTSDIQIETSRDIAHEVFNNTIQKLSGVASVERTGPRSARIRSAGTDTDKERLLSDLVALRIGLISFRPTASALEDTYLRLVKDTL